MDLHTKATVHNGMDISFKIVKNQYIKWPLGDDLVVNNLKLSKIINTTLSKVAYSTKTVTIITKMIAVLSKTTLDHRIHISCWIPFLPIFQVCFA